MAIGLEWENPKSKGFGPVQKTPYGPTRPVQGNECYCNERTCTYDLWGAYEQGLSGIWIWWIPMIQKALKQCSFLRDWAKIHESQQHKNEREWRIRRLWNNWKLLKVIYEGEKGIYRMVNQLDMRHYLFHTIHQCSFPSNWVGAFGSAIVWVMVWAFVRAWFLFWASKLVSNPLLSLPHSIF